jgi:ketosteroid isomerase-like protein
LLYFYRATNRETMHPNQQLIQNFYEAFQQLDAVAMQRCYHKDIRFSDPAFPALNGPAAGAMWGMLTETLKKGNGGWQLEFSQVQANDTHGSAHWEAHYTLTSTGNQVHNKIDARFRFQDGKIIEHVDSFDFYRWARMGFGFRGALLGWLPFFRKKVQATVNSLLMKYMERNGITLGKS